MINLEDEVVEKMKIFTLYTIYFFFSKIVSFVN